MGILFIFKKSISCFLICLLLCLIISTSSLASKTVVVEAIEDAFISSTNPNTNYGQSENLILQEGAEYSKALLRFDLTDYAADFASAGFTVQEAKLRLYYTDTGNQSGETAVPLCYALQPERVSWFEGYGDGNSVYGGATWSFYDFDISSWGIAGCEDAGSDYMADWSWIAQGSVPMDNTSGWHELIFKSTLANNIGIEQLFRSWAGLGNSAYGTSDPVNPGVIVLAGQSFLPQYISSKEGSYPAELLIQYDVSATNTATVIAEDDTAINDTNVTVSDGISPTLPFKESGGDTKRLMMRFDLSDFVNDFNDVNFKVISAKLKLYYEDVSNSGGNALPTVRALRPKQLQWQEGTGNGSEVNDVPTWSHYNYSDSLWAISGAESDANDYMGSWGTIADGIVEMDSLSGWHILSFRSVFDDGTTLKDLLRSWAGIESTLYGQSSTVNSGVIILAGQNLAEQSISSKEGIYAPTLVVEYLVYPQSCGNMGSILVSDINQDCYVNLQDLALVTAQWLQCNDPDNIECFE